MSAYLTHHIARQLTDERVRRDPRRAAADHAPHRRFGVRSVRPELPRRAR